jgi:hypothetical protein
MFRVIAICDDKRLPSVLHALDGLVYDELKVQPINNVEEKRDGRKKKIVQSTPGGGRVEIFLNALQKHKDVGDFDTEFLKSVMKEAKIPVNHSSISHIVNGMKKAKIIKHKSRGQYSLLPTK